VAAAQPAVTSIAATAEHATAAATSADPAGSVSPPATTATATATGYDATITVGIAAQAEAAAATATAYDPTSTITAPIETAAAPATAYDAVISTAIGAEAPAETSTCVATALDASTAIVSDIDTGGTTFAGAMRTIAESRAEQYRQSRAGPDQCPLSGHHWSRDGRGRRYCHWDGYSPDW
jgi:hypothetical protein